MLRLLCALCSTQFVAEIYHNDKTITLSPRSMTLSIFTIEGVCLTLQCVIKYTLLQEEKGKVSNDYSKFMLYY